MKHGARHKPRLLKPISDQDTPSINSFVISSTDLFLLFSVCCKRQSNKVKPCNKKVRTCGSDRENCPKGKLCKEVAQRTRVRGQNFKLCGSSNGMIGMVASGVVACPDIVEISTSMKCKICLLAVFDWRGQALTDNQ